MTMPCPPPTQPFIGNRMPPGGKPLPPGQSRLPPGTPLICHGWSAAAAKHRQQRGWHENCLPLGGNTNFETHHMFDVSQIRSSTLINQRHYCA